MAGTKSPSFYAYIRVGNHNISESIFHWYNENSAFFSGSICSRTKPFASVTESSEMM
jgi:hypothetical protein